MTCALSTRGGGFRDGEEPGAAKKRLTREQKEGGLEGSKKKWVEGLLGDKCNGWLTARATEVEK